MLTDSQRANVTKLAKDIGVDPAELLKEAEDMAAEDAKEGPETESTPDAEDAAEGEDKAKPDATDAPNGGRGFFAYQFPFLKVNEVRSSIGMPPIPDGDLFTGEWLPKHGGASSKATDGGSGGEAQA